MPDVDLTDRHPAGVRFFEWSKLRSCADNATLIFSFVSVPREVPPNTPLIGPYLGRWLYP
jgi:hypothetical protein